MKTKAFRTQLSQEKPTGNAFQTGPDKPVPERQG